MRRTVSDSFHSSSRKQSRDGAPSGRKSKKEEERTGIRSARQRKSNKHQHRASERIHSLRHTVQHDELTAELLAAERDFHDHPYSKTLTRTTRRRRLLESLSNLGDDTAIPVRAKGYRSTKATSDMTSTLLPSPPRQVSEPTPIPEKQEPSSPEVMPALASAMEEAHASNPVRMLPGHSPVPAKRKGRPTLASGPEDFYRSVMRLTECSMTSERAFQRLLRQEGLDGVDWSEFERAFQRSSQEAPANLASLFNLFTFDVEVVQRGCSIDPTQKELLVSTGHHLTGPGGSDH